MKLRRGNDSCDLFPEGGGIVLCFCTDRLEYVFLMGDDMRRWPQVNREWKE